jgi:hypothetical protein
MRFIISIMKIRQLVTVYLAGRGADTLTMILEECTSSTREVDEVFAY